MLRSEGAIDPLLPRLRREPLPAVRAIRPRPSVIGAATHAPELVAGLAVLARGAPHRAGGLGRSGGYVEDTCSARTIQADGQQGVSCPAECWSQSLVLGWKLTTASLALLGGGRWIARL